MNRFVFLLGFAVAFGAHPAGADEAGEVGVEPIVRLSGSEVAACGVAFSGLYKGAPYSVEFILEKSKVQPEFVLAALYDGPADVFNMSLITDAGSTAAFLPPPVPRPDGWIEARGPIPGLTGSQLVQTLMLSGGQLILGFTGQAVGVIDVALPGPFPQSVRASYLNCAGDLVRP